MRNLSVSLGRTAAELLAETECIRAKNPAINDIEYDMAAFVIRGTGFPADSVVYARKSATLCSVGNDFDRLDVPYPAADYRVLDTLLTIVEMYEWVAGADIGFLHDLPWDRNEKRDPNKKSAWIFLQDGVIKLAAVLTAASVLSYEWNFYECSRGLCWSEAAGAFFVPAFNYGSAGGAVDAADEFLLENGVLPVSGCEATELAASAADARTAVVKKNSEIVWEQAAGAWRRIAPRPASGNNDNAGAAGAAPADAVARYAKRNEWTAEAGWCDMPLTPIEKSVKRIHDRTMQYDDFITTGWNIKDARNLEFNRAARMAGILFETELAGNDPDEAYVTVKTAREAAAETARFIAGMDSWTAAAGFVKGLTDIEQMLAAKPNRHDDDDADSPVDWEFLTEAYPPVGFRRVRGVLAREHPGAAPAPFKDAPAADELRAFVAKYARRIARVRPQLEEWAAEHGIRLRGLRPGEFSRNGIV